MKKTDDWQLLNEYATQSSEEAFRTLVDRYAGLVYHAALRRVREPQTAQDVTQEVFIALAQKAGRIPPATLLSGWLYRATRFAVANRAREELRRQRREHEALMLDTTLRPAEAESVWDGISPHLDDALDKLSTKDREAVLIRFFEAKSHKEVALTLGVSEDAAKMRVSRAIERLRLTLAGRGFVVPTGVLLTALSTFAAHAPPAGVTAPVATAALAKGATGSALSFTLAQATLKLMAWSKLKTVSAVGVALLFGAGVLTVATRHWASPATPLNAGDPTLSGSTNMDRATPKATLRYLAAMLESGEGRKAAEAVQFDGRTDAQTEAAVEKVVIGQARFKRALVARFGAGTVTEALERWSLVKVPVEGLAQAEERIAHDSATVQLPGRGPLRFVRVAGSWRLALSMGNDPGTITRLGLAGRAMLETAGELEAGKYGSAEDAFRALQSRLEPGR